MANILWGQGQAASESSGSRDEEDGMPATARIMATLANMQAFGEMLQTEQARAQGRMPGQRTLLESPIGCARAHTRDHVTLVHSSSRRQSGGTPELNHELPSRMMHHRVARLEHNQIMGRQLQRSVAEAQMNIAIALDTQTLLENREREEREERNRRENQQRRAMRQIVDADFAASSQRLSSPLEPRAYIVSCNNGTLQDPAPGLGSCLEAGLEPDSGAAASHE